MDVDVRKEAFAVSLTCAATVSIGRAVGVAEKIEVLKGVSDVGVAVPAVPVAFVGDAITIELGVGVTKPIGFWVAVLIDGRVGCISVAVGFVLFVFVAFVGGAFTSNAWFPLEVVCA